MVRAQTPKKKKKKKKKATNGKKKKRIKDKTPQFGFSSKCPEIIVGGQRQMEDLAMTI